VKTTSAFIIAILLIAGTISAHDGPGSPPYLYVVDGEVEKAHIGSWTAAVKTLSEAHDRHDEGLYWVTFRELTGGPDVRVAFFRGFAKLAELDEWPSNRRVLVDVFGPHEGDEIKDALSLGVTSSDRVISRVDELSKPWTNHDPPKYLWVATTRVAEGKMTEYAALSKRVRRAFEQHAENLRWMCYANAIGGSGSELVFFYGFDSFSEVDEWPSRREVLAATLGERDGRRLASAIEAISETTTSLWKLEPELSRLPEEE
jgi:hypothetical protein